MNKTDWYKHAVIYQIYPFSYMDANNDGVGDIKGILSKLDYIKGLGVNAIWFSPLYDSPNNDYGYDVRDYKKISPTFGTMDEFKELLNECHKRDIKVVMDMVLNHTSNEHKWFTEAIKDKDSKYRDYYIIRKGRKRGNKYIAPNNWTSTFTGSAWEKIEGTDEFYLHLFTKEQPDLNWDNPKVREEAQNILKFYLDMGVDGFRFDVFNVFSKVEGLPNDHNPFAIPKGGKYYIDGPKMHEYLHELNNKSYGNYDSMTVGESFTPSKEDALRYVDKNNEEVDMLFNFAHLVSDNKFGLKFFKKKFNIMQFKDGFFGPQNDYYNNGWNSLVLENHDNPRSISRFSLNSKEFRYECATMLALIMFMGFGTPFIYQGEEIGMTNVEFSNLDEMKDPVSHFVYNLGMKIFHSPKKVFKMVSYGSRDHARVPMQWDDSVNAGFNTGANPWMMVNPNYKEINVLKDLESDKSIYKFYQKVFKLREEKDAIIYGRVKEYSHNNKNLIAYSRIYKGVEYFIIGNFKDKKIKYKFPKTFNNHSLSSLLSNYTNTSIKDGSITLYPYQATIYEVKENINEN